MNDTENVTVEDAAFEELDEESGKTPEIAAADDPVEDATQGEITTGKNYPTQVVLTIRMIVGIYVAYLAYQIITSKEEIASLMWVPIVIFIVAGAALVITSVKHFVCGEYEGGKKDV